MRFDPNRGPRSLSDPRASSTEDPDELEQHASTGFAETRPRTRTTDRFGPLAGQLPATSRLESARRPSGVSRPRPPTRRPETGVRPEKTGFAKPGCCSRARPIRGVRSEFRVPSEVGVCQVGVATGETVRRSSRFRRPSSRRSRLQSPRVCDGLLLGARSSARRGVPPLKIRLTPAENGGPATCVRFR